MGVIAKNENQITLYYNSETSLGKQTLPYVESAEKDVLAVDISKTKVTGTQWAELAENLKVPIKDLVDQEHPNFVEIYGKDKVDLDENDWFRVLEKSPSVLTCAIVVDGNKAIPIKSPSDFVKYMDDDSAGLEETPKL